MMKALSKTITLKGKKDAWIKCQIDAGHDTNDSEYIGDFIRREQGHSREIEVVRTALIEGKASGKPRVFDADSFKQRMVTKHG